jgi:hypothetical protein
MLHVLQANYCDFCVTGEEKHLDYAHVLLAPSTKVSQSTTTRCRSTNGLSLSLNRGLVEET